MLCVRGTAFLASKLPTPNFQLPAAQSRHPYKPQRNAPSASQRLCGETPGIALSAERRNVLCVRGTAILASKLHFQLPTSRRAVSLPIKSNEHLDGGAAA